MKHLNILSPGRKPIDITGQRFGALTVIEYARAGKGTASGSGSGSMWLCQCDCGNTKEVRGTALRFGHIGSCGCKKNEKQKGPGQNAAKDITGQKFGALTAIAVDGRGNGKLYWRCVCDCGTETRVRGTDLRHGNTKSCGCLKMAGVSNYLKATSR